MTSIQDSSQATPDNPGWRAHPVTARGVWASVYLAPLAIGAASAVLLHAVVSRPASGGGLIAWWLLGIAVCSAMVAATFHFAQRALPRAVAIVESDRVAGLSDAIAREMGASTGAPIVAVAQAFATMTSHRSDEWPVSPAVARETISAGAGSQFDPDVVRAFERVPIGRLGRLWPLAVVGHVPIAIHAALTSSAQRVATRAAETASAGAAALASVAMVTGAGSLSHAPSLVAQAPRPSQVARATPAPYESIPVPLERMDSEPAPEVEVLAEAITAEDTPRAIAPAPVAVAAPEPLVDLHVESPAALPLPLDLDLTLIPGIKTRLPILGLDLGL